MSSSNRNRIPEEAALYREDRPVGPVRLPMIEKGSFVEEFNRVYRALAIEIARNSDASYDSSQSTET